MSAWSNDLSNAPKDKQIMFRHPDWECPVIVYWAEHEEWKGWLFADSLLSDVQGAIDEEDYTAIEWANIPE